ncbi:MAG TPA: heavy metal resistance protein CzcA [Candidatus Nitrosotenuis sp.]|jgi:DNA excision repair protein ERCC-4|nr:heavy metal resistance protein CzcA [Candidatus Nitrosotenuis sp.]HIH46189.1 heavy metal resistance protein CzcA [Candidatus Nitrosotenuis sp.]HIH68853.1 heavy metal resistance protein CzcA [Candidatus Nitrosotenuis sp.]
MGIENLRIVVDEREKKSGIPDLLRAVGINLEVKTLPVGDYIVAPETIVERKSVSDLISSVFDGRLFDQCNRLKEHFAHPVILMEGNVEEIEQIVENPLVFYGAISAVAIDFKIPIIPTPNATHSAKMLISMCSRKDSLKGPFLKKIKKSDDVTRQQLSVLCSLPGIGEKLATRMLTKFGSPSKTLNASTADLAKVDGLGEARAKKIKQMLEHTSKHHKQTNQKTLDA